MNFCIASVPVNSAVSTFRWFVFIADELDREPDTSDNALPREHLGIDHDTNIGSLLVQQASRRNFEVPADGPRSACAANIG